MLLLVLYQNFTEDSRYVHPKFSWCYLNRSRGPVCSRRQRTVLDAITNRAVTTCYLCASAGNSVTPLNNTFSGGILRIPTNTSNRILLFSRVLKVYISLSIDEIPFFKRHICTGLFIPTGPVFNSCLLIYCVALDEKYRHIFNFSELWKVICI